MASLDRAHHRFMELEGLRGMAAIIVVVFHALLLFYPGMMYGISSYGSTYTPNMPLEKFWYGNPLGGLLSGTFAVSIFFVLSGFVLTVGFFQKKNPEIIKRLAAKRYIRLMLPALVSIMFAYALMKLGLSIGQGQTSAITHSVWLQGLWTMPPHFLEAITQGLYGMFMQVGASYNPVLWTISYELIGSFVVFAGALLFAQSKYRWIIYGVMLFWLWNTWLFGFALGMLMADMYVSRRNVLAAIRQPLLWPLLILGIFLGGYPPNETTGTLYAPLGISQLSMTQNQSFYTALGATLVVLCVILLPRLAGFFAHKRISILGRYTYSLYLVHMPLLLTVCTGIFVALHAHMGLHRASVISIVLYLVVVGIATYVFERFIDAPSTKLSGVVADIYFEKRSLSLGTKFVGIFNYIRRRMVRNGRFVSPVVVVDLDNETS